jgi:hypothetical protein
MILKSFFHVCKQIITLLFIGQLLGQGQADPGAAAGAEEGRTQVSILLNFFGQKVFGHIVGTLEFLANFHPETADKCVYDNFGTRLQCFVALKGHENQFL